MTGKSVRQGIIGLIVVLGIVAAPAGAADAGLTDAIGKLVAGAGKMKIGVRVEALGPGPAVIFERDAGEPLQPASNQKLVVTAAALCLLSPDFSYRTMLAVRGDDLVIVGAGDPSCGDPAIAEAAKQPITAMFHQWAERLKAAGTARIRGDLLFDDSIFDDEFVLASWRKQFNTLEDYCAPVGGLSFYDNCIGVIIRPGQGGIGSPAEAELVPATSWITLQNTAKTAKTGEPLVKRVVGTGRAAASEPAGGADADSPEPITIAMSGSVSRANDPQSPLLIPVTDPGMLFASACRTALAAQGITIEGRTRRARVRLANGTLPSDLKTVAVHESKLTEILWRANKSSQNMFAEAVLKTLGAYAGREAAPGVGSYETGRAAVQRFLDGLHVPREGYVIDDGSGLSHNDRTTAATMTAILQHMNDHPLRKQWWDSLAVPGESSGTLRRRMKDLAGKVVAKTGHIEGVNTLSGYVIGADKQVYAFSILCNETGKSKVSPHEIQDGICRKLATWGAAEGKGKGQKSEKVRKGEGEKATR